MSCEMCGECCEFATLIIKDTNSQKWLELHRMVVIGKLGNDLMVKVPIRCSELIDGRCNIYNTRPHVCSEYKCVKNVLNGVLFAKEKNGKDI